MHLNLIANILDILKILFSFKPFVNTKIYKYILTILSIILLIFGTYYLYINKTKEDKAYQTKKTQEIKSASYRLLEKCQSEAEGESLCNLTWFKIETLTSANTKFKLNLMIRIKAKINTKGEYVQQMLIVDQKYRKVNNKELTQKKSYIMPNWRLQKILNSGRCGHINVKDIKKEDPLYTLIDDQLTSPKLEKISYCFGGCSLTLSQQKLHVASKCTTPYCQEELSNFYYKYYDDIDNKACFIDFNVMSDK